MLGTGAVVAATVLAGLASVVVQLGGAVYYAAFAVLAAVVVALAVAAVRWFRAARAVRPSSPPEPEGRPIAPGRAATRARPPR